MKDSPGVKSHCIRGVKDLMEFRVEEEADQNMVQKNPNRYEWKMPLELVSVSRWNNHNVTPQNKTIWSRYE